MAEDPQGRELRFTITESDLGSVLVAATARGVRAVSIGDDAAGLERELRAAPGGAGVVRDDAGLRAWAAAVAALAGGEAHTGDPVPLDLHGTPFQCRVWDALRAIPRGETRSYQMLAADLGDPRAARAVAGACARNHAAIVVPCHRVVRTDGGLGGYRWGIERKRALLEREGAASAARTAPQLRLM